MAKSGTYSNKIRTHTSAMQASVLHCVQLGTPLAIQLSEHFAQHPNGAKRTVFEPVSLTRIAT